ncbi:hypothetical protein ACNI3K_08835 [Demequina sp. SO4-13]|uniref:hypothetical protein n=1 Tax=Demequina sp. SO4-13 TaxID=3401027 RepID=UPI003AF8F30E
MGERLVVAPGELDGAWAGADIIVPGLPSRVRWTVRSDATLAALEQASRAIGRVEGAFRNTSSSIGGIYYALAISAASSASLVDGKVQWSRVRQHFLHDHRDVKGLSGDALAAALLRQSVGLGNATAHGHRDPVRRYQGALDAWPSAIGSEGPLPRRFARELAADLASWVPHGSEPPMARAALAMMTVAAVDPDCGSTGIAARMLFSTVLEDAKGVEEWMCPPISWGFLAEPKDSWQRVASVLAVEGEPDPHAVDRALGEVFLAVARSGAASRYMVEHAGRYAIEQAGGRHSKTFTPRQKLLIDALVGLPALTAGQAARVSGLTERGVQRSLKVLVAAEIAEVRRTRKGEEFFVATRPMTMWLDAVNCYPLPGEPWPKVQ